MGAVEGVTKPSEIIMTFVFSCPILAGNKQRAKITRITVVVTVGAFLKDRFQWLDIVLFNIIYLKKAAH